MTVPTLSAQQKRVIKSDGVTLLGYDEANRPVVQQKERWGHTLQTWALKRDGDPIEPKGTITPVSPG